MIFEATPGLGTLAAVAAFLAPVQAPGLAGAAVPESQAIAAENQASAFLDRLEAGDLAGARAALPRNVRLGLHRFPERMAWFRLVTRGCARGEMIVSQFSWLERSSRPRPSGRPTQLSPARLTFHRIIMPGAPPPDIGTLALTSNWDCPGSKQDVVLYFYLVDDRIVRVAYDLPPQGVPLPPQGAPAR